MNRKVIKSVLNKKLNEWLKSIKDDYVHLSHNPMGKETKATPVIYPPRHIVTGEDMKLEMEENERTIKEKLSYIKNSQIIKDPFPDHTTFNSFLLRTFMDPPEYVSIWSAYRKGYEQAYKEIEQAIGLRELK